MTCLILADFVAALHFLFVLFAVLGGGLVLKWRRLAVLHLPAVVWAAMVEIAGWVCPLTPLENWLRSRGGSETYPGDFVGQYLLAALYPGGLTRTHQVVLGVLVAVVNLVIYVLVIRRHRTETRLPS
jgi:hypothetical protein